MVFAGEVDPDDLRAIGEDRFLPDWVIMGCSCGGSGLDPCRHLRGKVADERAAAERQAAFRALLPEDREWLANHVRLVIA